VLEDKYGKTYPKKDRKRQKKTKKDKKDKKKGQGTESWKSNKYQYKGIE